MNKLRFFLCIFTVGTTLGPAPAQAPRRLPVISGNGFLTVMVETDGSVKAWGKPTNLSLGDGMLKPGINITEPITIAAVRDAVSVAVGESQVMILLSNGTVVGWGANGECEVGNGDPGKKLKRWERLDAATKPVPIPGLHDIAQVAAGNQASGAVMADGSVWMWGTGNDGFVANGTFAPKGDNVACTPVPQRVEGLTGIKQLSLGITHALALREDGTVWAWGKNDRGQLGDESREPRARPVQVRGISNAVAIAAGVGTSAAVLADGSVRAWGDNSNAGVGDPAPGADRDDDKRYHLKPFAVPGISGARSVRAGLGFIVVHLKDGTLRGWGEGYYGGLGTGTGDGIYVRPQTPSGVGPVLAHYVAGRRNYALREDGTVMGWGPINMTTQKGPIANALVPVALFKIQM